MSRKFLEDSTKFLEISTKFQEIPRNILEIIRNTVLQFYWDGEITLTTYRQENRTRKTSKLKIANETMLKKQ